MKAEIDYSKDPGAVLWVGERLLHQYWPLLAPYFRDILLAPHRRPDADVISWTWDSGGAHAISSADLNSVRKRLAKEVDMFADNVSREAAAGSSGDLRGGAALQELAATMRQCVAELVSKRDPELAPFVCRTSAGVRLHSWGARAPAKPFDPERQLHPGEVQRIVPDARSGRRLAIAVLVTAAVALAVMIGLWLYHRNSQAPAIAPSAKQAPPADDAERINRARGALASHAAESHLPSTPSRSALAPAPLASGMDAPIKDRQGGGAPERHIAQRATNADPAAKASQITEERSVAGAAKGNSREIATSIDPSLPPSATGTPSGQGGLPKGEGGAPIESAPMRQAENTAGPSAAQERNAAKSIPVSDDKPLPAAPRRDVVARTQSIRVTEADVEADASQALTPDVPEVSDRTAAKADATRDEESAEDGRRRKGVRANKPEVAAVELAGEVGRQDFSSVKAGSALIRTWKIHPPAWRVEMLGDVILPTEPRRRGSAVALEALRDEARRQREAARPAAFRVPRIAEGCVIHPTHSAQAKGWSRSGGRAGSAAVGTVTAGGAELRWMGMKTAAPEGPYTLHDGRGDVIARIAIDEGGVTIQATDRISIDYFIEVSVPAAAEGARNVMELRWQSSSGLPLSPGFRSTIEPDVARLEVAMTAPPVTSSHVALFDRGSGWALIGDVKVVGE